jgi:hypothetical protein
MWMKVFRYRGETFVEPSETRDMEEGMRGQQ